MEIPDGVRVLNVLGAEYYIQWEGVSRGASFFIPTTATPKQVYVALAPARHYFDFEFEVRARKENGIFGARVWRTY